MYEILFVDDDESIGFIISKFNLWKNSRFKIKKQARNGKEALEMLEKEAFDLVITDIRMPMVDGLELIKSMRHNGDKTAVILSSTYSDFEYAKEGLQLGAVDYIVKPLSEEDLSKALQRVENLFLEREIEKKKVTENISISKEKIEQWYNQMIHNDKDKSKLAAEFCNELEQLYPNRIEAYPVIMEQSLSQMWKNICYIFPWIEQLEDFKCTFTDEDLCSQSESAIESLQCIINKYELNKQDSLISKICALIVSNISNEKILDFVAAEIGLSKDYIGKMFRNKLGITMGEYCTLIKMEYAKKMLQDSNMKIYEISTFLGYTTVDYFSKLFKNNVGHTPMQYRKQLLV